MTGREISRRLLLHEERKCTVAEIGAGRAGCPQVDEARVAEIAVGMNILEVVIKDREETPVRTTGEMEGLPQRLKPGISADLGRRPKGLLSPADRESAIQGTVAVLHAAECKRKKSGGKTSPPPFCTG
jgi:hypothetical protein